MPIIVIIPSQFISYYNYTNAYSINLQTSSWPGCIEYQLVDLQPHRTIDYQDHFEDEDVLHSVGGEMCMGDNKAMSM